MDTCPSPRRASWNSTYDRILAIAKDLGRLPRLSDGVDPRLVNWPSNQRRSSRLTPEQRAALEQLPGWSWDPAEDAWLDRAEKLRTFRESHDGRLPRERDPEESVLAHWLSRQLVAQRTAKLATHRSDILDYILRD